MKKDKKVILVCSILLVLINSCIPSLHPLYTEQDLLFDNNMLGTWVSGSDKDQSIWKFEKFMQNAQTPTKRTDGLHNKKYSLKHVQYGDTATFDVHLLKLGEYLYLDFYPQEHEERNVMKSMHLFPVHTFAKVDIHQNSIKIEQFDIGFLEELIEQNKIKISHEKSDGNILLTAPTEELQKFVVKYAEDENAFADSINLRPKI